MGVVNQTVVEMAARIKAGCRVIHHGGSYCRIGGGQYHYGHVAAARALVKEWAEESRQEAKRALLPAKSDAELVADIGSGS